MRAPPLTKRELLSSRSPFPCVSESFVTRPRTRAINVSERSNGWYDVRRELPSPLPELRFIGLLRHDPPETRFVNSLVETRLTPGPADHLHSAPLPLTCFRFAIPRGFTSPAISRTRCLLFLWDVWNKLQDCINKDNNNIRVERFVQLIETENSKRLLIRNYSLYSQLYKYNSIRTNCRHDGTNRGDTFRAGVAPVITPP